MWSLPVLKVKKAEDYEPKKEVRDVRLQDPKFPVEHHIITQEEEERLIELESSELDIGSDPDIRLDSQCSSPEKQARTINVQREPTNTGPDPSPEETASPSIYPLFGKQSPEVGLYSLVLLC